MNHDEAVGIARGMARQIVEAIDADGAQSVALRREQNGAMQTYEVTLQTGVRITICVYGLDMAPMRAIDQTKRETKPPIHLVVPASKKRSRKARAA